MSLELIGFLFTNFAGLLGTYIALRERVRALETKVDILMGDIDGVANVVGTERARARLNINRFKRSNL